MAFKAAWLPLARGSQPRPVWLPGHMWQCLAILLVVTAEGVGVMPLVVKVMDVAKYSTEPGRIFSPPPCKGGGEDPAQMPKGEGEN